MRRRIALILMVVVVAIAAAPGSGAAPAAPGQDDLVRLNEIQVIGSHNSYHLAATPEESALRRTFIGEGEDRLLYQHDPLATQFSSQRVRQIELDVWVDTAGGRYATPLLRTATGQGPYDPVMSEPGLKVFHTQDVDYRSTCLTLVACLQTVETWSAANPSHLPLAILIELKDGPLELGDIDFVDPEPFDAAALDSVDAEIRSVFDEDHLLTPDDVRGDHETLEDAVLTDGWPTLGESRGKVMFLMDNGGGKRELYRDGHPSLEGRVLFTNGVPGEADAAFVKENEAIGNDRIAELVEAGYVVRTRAEVETLEARANDTTRRDAALASGAQWVSTDYPVPDHGFGFTTDYSAGIPGGTVARCNPVNGPAGCVSADLEPSVAPPGSGSSTTTTVAPAGRKPAPPATPVRARARFTG
jgi:hypothetical protein